MSKTKDTPVPVEQEFKKFWVKTVNGWICDAGYNGKELKEKSPTPTFRKYYFIREWEDVKRFKKHGELCNIELCKSLLSNQ